MTVEVAEWKSSPTEESVKEARAMLQEVPIAAEAPSRIVARRLDGLKSRLAVEHGRADRLSREVLELRLRIGEIILADEKYRRVIESYLVADASDRLSMAIAAGRGEIDGE